MMKYIILFITYYYILSINSITVSAQKPAADYVGLRLFLTEKGFGYLESVAKQLILKDLQNITIPDVNFDKDGFKGSLSGLKCTNFALENLTFPGADTLPNLWRYCHTFEPSCGSTRSHWAHI